MKIIYNKYLTIFITFYTLFVSLDPKPALV
jgi:hypothetical protein